ncbi:MAG: fumarylacetoacetate hydrolase family protein [Chitinophagales bacterium]|nr:fumarylacetoacetate hydrolase family protein [Chitinophagales bacterium]
MKIFCVGRNYAEHAKELNNAIPENPLIFMKPPTALLKDDKPFYYPNFSNDIHYEVEVVIKISKNGKKIDAKFAHKYYNEFTLGIDFTARDIQSQLKEKGHPWEIAKGFDSSAVIGTFLNKKDYDLENLTFSLLKNNEVVQKGNTKQMIYNIDTIISYISNYYMLQTGDLIYTGTPKGVGAVSIGNKLIGKIEEKEIFYTEIK